MTTVQVTSPTCSALELKEEERAPKALQILYGIAPTPPSHRRHGEKHPHREVQNSSNLATGTPKTKGEREGKPTHSVLTTGPKGTKMAKVANREHPTLTRARARKRGSQTIGILCNLTNSSTGRTTKSYWSASAVRTTHTVQKASYTRRDPRYKDIIEIGVEPGKAVKLVVGGHSPLARDVVRAGLQGRQTLLVTRDENGLLEHKQATIIYMGTVQGRLVRRQAEIQLAQAITT